MNSAETTKKLLELAAAIPDLPIVAMVAADIPGDDYGYWLSGITSVSIDEYVVSNSGSVLFKSDNDVDVVLQECLSEEEYDKLPDNIEDCRPAYENLPWKKVIILRADSM